MALLSEKTRWRALGYGFYRARDGRIVVHNRRYEPLFEADVGEDAVKDITRIPYPKPGAWTWWPADPNEWIDCIVPRHGPLDYFSNDSHSEYEKQKRSLAAMAALGIHKEAIKIKIKEKPRKP